MLQSSKQLVPHRQNRVHSGRCLWRQPCYPPYPFLVSLTLLPQTCWVYLTPINHLTCNKCMKNTKIVGIYQLTPRSLKIYKLLWKDSLINIITKYLYNIHKLQCTHGELHVEDLYNSVFTMRNYVI